MTNARDGRPVALLLPGQGCQWPGMAVDLYRQNEVFARAVDEALAGLGPAGAEVRTDWLSARPVVPLDHPTRSQPLIFAIDYGLAQAALDWGVRPVALLGHSVGELVAAVLADVLTVRDAAALLWDRLRRVARAPAGGMLAVAARPADLTGLLRDGVAVAALNAPLQTVLAGPRPALDDAAAEMAAAGFVCRPVPSLSAFHSPVLAPCLVGSAEAIAATARRAPRLRIYSAYTGGVIDTDRLLDPDYFASQPVSPVLFWPTLQALLADGDWTLLEAGPGQDLSRIARRHPLVRAGRSRIVPMLPGDDTGDGVGDEAALARVRRLVR